MRKRLVIFVIGSAVIVGFFLLPQKQTITINGHELSVWIADSPQERERGLSGRKSLREDEGMLFVYPEPTTPTFWMKDMHFPIDIVWLNDDFGILGIERNISPDTYPQIFEPPVAVRYVLETNPGLLPF